MKRRHFLGLLVALPFVRNLEPEPKQLAFDGVASLPDGEYQVVGRFQVVGRDMDAFERQLYRELRWLGRKKMARLERTLSESFYGFTA
jgi:hypothetical protein